MEAINDLLRIHKACDVGKEVQRGLDWYAEIVDWPANVEEYPNNQSITHFQNLLYSSRTDEVLVDYDMPVDELSKLCCTRWLSSDHICWMTETLNKAQGETYWLRTARSVFLLARKCTRLAVIMAMTCVMRHAWNEVF